ncbi:molybdopterin-dependent oxidoreductase [Rhodococcus sp. HM1]|uniref:molybdopterin-dependent oxidoreductase n=1 Tax=Rhodococcus sp. HM1 TaxID=2937759 RepID=UPI00200A9EFB|nr:molybdopterin-dependent oxidoreductase [Rhodococcus sp. HM1]MCK8669917.1 molybdopterin-dependent oxidoreductase [Rhodococcus sp. HM1]
MAAPPSTRPPSTGSPGVLSRAATGVVAVLLVLGVGELLAAATDPDASPFFAVGGTTVDRAPAWAREFAIGTFGTADKPALFVGMSVLLAVCAVVAGLIERPRRPYGGALLAALGAVGVYAALHRPEATATAAIPTVIAVVVGMLFLQFAIRALWTPRGGEDPASPNPDRRRFLVVLGAGVAVAVVAGAVGRYLADRLAVVLEDRDRFRVPLAADAAPAIPPGADLTTGPRAVPGATAFVTTNRDFYRIDTALQVPRLTTADWRLRIHGMVDRETTLTWDDLAAFETVERLVTLTCVSNEVGGDLAGNARWTGYRIADILDRVGVHPDADMLLSTSVDGFTVGTPVEVLRDGRDALLAVAMNGEPLPLQHGYPARQVVPGLYGYVSATKWVVDWELTRFDRAEAYWTRRGWAAKGPIRTASRIDVPARSARLTAGPVVVAGTAWAQHRGIDRIEVRVDGGPWQEAEPATEYSVDTWRQWRWVWDASPGDHTLEVRAVDGTGAIQDEQRRPPVPDGATGLHSRTVTVVA